MQASGLDRLLIIVQYTSLGIAALEGAAALVAWSLPLALISAASLGFGLLTGWARRWVHAGATHWASVITATGLLPANLVAAVAFPDFAPVLVIVPIIAIVLVRPYVPRSWFIGVAVVACVVAALVVVIGETVQLFPPPPAHITLVLLVVEVVIGIGLIALALSPNQA